MAIDDLKKAQDAGWVLVGATDKYSICRCPSYGCGVKLRIPYGTTPQRCDPGLSRDPISEPVGSYDELRRKLRHRREEMLLSIPEVEDIAGLTVDHIKKAEKDNPSRIPEFDTLVLWAQALGFELVLRHSGLPNLGIRFIDDTRRWRPRRKKMRDRLRRERGEA